MALVALLSLDDFKARTIMPASDVDLVESLEPGWTDQKLLSFTARMYSALRKRYSVPFAAPYPEAALVWLTQLATPEVYRKRGVNPQDPQLVLAEKDRDSAWAEIKEAADSQNGLFDLPLLDDGQASAITQGGPYTYSEQSPYEWTDRQVEAIRGR